MNQNHEKLVTMGGMPIGSSQRLKSIHPCGWTRVGLSARHNVKVKNQWEEKNSSFFLVFIIYKKEIQNNFRCKKYVHNMLIVYVWKLIHWEDQDMLALDWQS